MEVTKTYLVLLQLGLFYIYFKGCFLNKSFTEETTRMILYVEYKGTKSINFLTHFKCSLHHKTKSVSFEIVHKQFTYFLNLYNVAIGIFYFKFDL